MNFKVLATVLIALAGLVASLLVRRQGEVALRANEENIRSQEIQLIDLQAENERLSKLARQAVQASPSQQSSELSKLRDEATALRIQVQELERALESKRQAAAATPALRGESYVSQSNRVVMSHLRHLGKVADGRNLVRALVEFAQVHQAQFPSGLDELARSKFRARLSGTNYFEMIFQGSLNDLTNIPPRSVALIREQQPWVNQDGKAARVYGMADGATLFVESDDNFESWEAEHIVPPPAGP